tara:strand:+ start:1464 stop:2504 length:1041 start_codon:yes stop_codon:yes gene_type:complete
MTNYKKKLKKNKILITGSAGFIGFHVCKTFLKNNYSVCGIDNLNDYYDVKLKKDRTNFLKNKFKNYKFIKIDISNKKSLEKLFKIKRFDTVINLAAQAGVRYSIKNPDAYVKSNLQGFCNLIELSTKYKIKHFVYASTSSVYGMNQKQPLSEKDNVDHPIQFYAATKRSNELIAHAYSHLFNLPTTGLRFFTVYGPWGRPDMALFLFTKNILKNKPIEIFNNGDHIRDFTYVDDVAKSVFYVSKKKPKKNKYIKDRIFPAISSAPFRVLNIGNNKPIKLLEYVKQIELKLKKKSKRKYLPLQKGDIRMTLADNKNIKKLIGFTPNTPIKFGINKFINWYLEYYNVK